MPLRARVLVRREPPPKPVDAAPDELVAAVPGTPMDGLVIEPGGGPPEAGPLPEGHAVAGRPAAVPEGGAPWEGATTPEDVEGHAVPGRPDAPTPGGPSGAPCTADAGPFGRPPFPGPMEAGAGSGAGAMPQVSQYPSTTVPAHPGCVHLVIRPLRSE
ncbi:hypothetical protein AB0B89_21350 [Sphaerisporangium sp. NPDC049002]|uniref:hypothetical protein n=1 Tax=Sphaerisporangium sp. NPDC049002 TaxID=3155392 RepID=UPI0033E6696D